jgi:hypothetical protein
MKNEIILIVCNLCIYLIMNPKSNYFQLFEFGRIKIQAIQDIRNYSKYRNSVILFCPQMILDEQSNDLYPLNYSHLIQFQNESEMMEFKTLMLQEYSIISVVYFLFLLNQKIDKDLNETFKLFSGLFCRKSVPILQMHYMKQLYFILKEFSDENLMKDVFFDFLNVNGSSMFVAFENFDSTRFKNTTMLRYAIMSGLLRIESSRYLNLLDNVLNEGSSFSNFAKLKKFLKNEEISQFHLFIGYKECLKLVWENIEFDYQKKLDEFNTRIHLESKLDELVSQVKINPNSSIRNAKLILKELENKKFNEKLVQHLKESFNSKIHVNFKKLTFKGATCVGEIERMFQFKVFKYQRVWVHYPMRKAIKIK